MVRQQYLRCPFLVISEGVNVTITPLCCSFLPPRSVFPVDILKSPLRTAAKVSFLFYNAILFPSPLSVPGSSLARLAFCQFFLVAFAPR